MRFSKSTISLVILMTCLVAITTLAAAQGLEPENPTALLGTSFTFQGRLTDGGSPANGNYDLRFILYDAESGGSQIGSTLVKDDVPVNGGIFTVSLDFGSSPFRGLERWLETSVRLGTSTGTYTVLSPRQSIYVVPNALFSTSAPWSGLSGVPAGFADGVDNDTTSFWSLTGNSGTTPETDFIGTTDNRAFEVKVNGQRVLRVEPANDSTNDFSPNIIAGAPGNSVEFGVVGATIAGGGTSEFPNRAGGNFASVGGGFNNTASSDYATVGGGSANTASDSIATVGGGFINTASGLSATVGGGSANTASGRYVTVSGGAGNTASGEDATVPGGLFNTAAGRFSFAAGRRAKANQDGVFVWADSTDADFVSTGVNTFRVRATGGSEFVAGNGDFGLAVQNTDSGDGIRALSNTSSGSNWAALYAINSGSSPAIFANSDGTYSGVFADDIYVAGNCVGCSLVFVAQNAGDAALEVGDLVTASGIAPALSEESEPVLLVRRADDAAVGVVGVVQSRAQIVASEKYDQVAQSADKADGPVQPGDHLFIVVQGLAQVKVDASMGAIAAGQRLAATGMPGHARALKTVQVEGITIEEGAPLVGVALESQDAGQGLVWVLVTLR